MALPSGFSTTLSDPIGIRLVLLGLVVMPTIPNTLLTIEEIEHLGEDYTFYVFRTDTNAVLARGIQGFEAAKARAN